MQIPVPNHDRKSALGFSLVEVVLSLAIVVFVIFGLVGLLGVGLQNSADSRARTQAATIAEQICSIRRAAPTTDLTTPQPNFPLPVMNQPVATPSLNNFATPIYLTRDGQKQVTPDGADFGFLYSITTKYNSVPAPPSTASRGVSQVYMCFFWPPRANPTNPITGRYEVTTTFALQ